MRRVAVCTALLVFVLLLGLDVPVGQATNVNNLKGTYSIFPQGLRELSPLEGAIAWHTGLIRRLYGLGHVTDGEPIDKPRRNDPAFTEKLEDFNNRLEEWKNKKISAKSSTRFVVRNLFYREPWTTSVSDFKVSTLLERVGTPKDVAAAVAKTLASVWLYQQVKRDFAGLERFASVQDFSVSSSGPESSEKAVKGFKLNGTQFQKALEDPLFSGYDVVRYSLLAVLWCRCGGDRSLLKVYVEELKTSLQNMLGALKEALEKRREELDRSVDAGKGRVRLTDDQIAAIKSRKTKQLEIVSNLVNWCTNKLADVDRLNVPDEPWVGDAFVMEALIADVPNMDITALISTDEAAGNYEKAVYLRLLPAQQPNDASYSGGVRLMQDGLAVEVGGAPITFADCMDMTMRNLLNHVAFKDGLFSTKNISDLTEKEPHVKVIEFYRKNDKAVAIAELAVHNAWTEVISNIPWVEYAQQHDTSGGIHKDALIGFIKIPAKEQTEDLKRFLSSKGYALVDEAVMLFELQPTCRNIIMVLDHLLNLNLFEGKSKAEEFARDDFVKEYLPKAFEKIGVVKQLPDNIDMQDFTHCSITFTVQLFSNAIITKISYPVKFTIDIRGHGQFHSERLDVAARSVFDRITKDVVAALPSSALLLLGFWKLQTLLDQTFDVDYQQWLRLAIFAQDIDNPDKATSFVDYIARFDEHWYTLMRFFVELHVDVRRKQIILLKIFNKAVASGLATVFEDAITAANSLLLSDNESVRLGALTLLRELIKKEKGIEPALIAVRNEIENPNLNTQLIVLDLCQVLVEESQGFEEALMAVRKGMTRSERVVRTKTLDLWRALVKKEKSIEDAIAATDQEILSSDFAVRESAIALWRVLLEKGWGFTKTAIAVGMGMASGNAEVQKDSLVLWQALLEKLTKCVNGGSRFQEAFEVVNTGLTIDNQDVRRGALSLCQSLLLQLIHCVDNGNDFEQALTVAVTWIMSENAIVQRAVVDLWQALLGMLTKLVNKGSHFEEAIVAANSGLVSGNETVQRGALDLWRALFEQKAGFERAILVAQIGIKNSNLNVQRAAFALWLVLVTKEKNFQEAIVAASSGVHSDNRIVRQDALDLWQTLFEKGVGFENAIIVAGNGIMSLDLNVRQAALDLWRALLKKDHGFKDAIITASRGLMSGSEAVRESILGLWHTLVGMLTVCVNEGRYFEEAFNVANIGLVSSNTNVERDSFSLWQTLLRSLTVAVNDGSHLEEVVAVATAGLVSDNQIVQQGALDLWRILVEKEKNFDEAITAANTGMMSGLWIVQQAALSLWKALFKKEKGFEPAIVAARNGIESSNLNVQQVALGLWRALVENGKGFEPAIVAVRNGIESPNLNTQVIALDLCKALVEKSKGFDDALMVARKGMVSVDGVERIYVLNLWRALVEKGKGVEDAIAVAGQETLRSESVLREGVLNLWRAILGQERGFVEAAVAVKSGMASYEVNERRNSLFLWQALLEKLTKCVNEGNYFEEAFAVANSGLASSNEIMQKGSLILLKVLVAKLTELVKKGSHFEEAITVANKVLARLDVHQEALTLWQVVLGQLTLHVKEGDHFKEAIAVATDGMANSNKEVQLTALTLWRAMIEKLKTSVTDDKFLQDAEIVVRKSINESFPDDIQKQAFELLSMLVQHGNCIELAIDVVGAYQPNVDRDSWYSVLSLWKKLFEQNKGFEKAIEIASSSMKNRTDENYAALKGAWSLWRLLVENGKGLEAAVDVAFRAAKNSNFQADAVELLIMAVQKGYGFAKAIDVAQELVRNKYTTQPATKVATDDFFGLKNLASPASISQSPFVLDPSDLGTLSTGTSSLYDFSWPGTLASSTSIKPSESYLDLGSVDMRSMDLSSLDTSLLETSSVGSLPMPLNTLPSSSPELNLWQALFKQGQGFDAAQKILPELDEATRQKLQNLMNGVKSVESPKLNPQKRPLNFDMAMPESMAAF